MLGLEYMACVISFVSSKGGTGRTTTAVNLGAYLVAYGRSVLLIDLDPQAHATRALDIKRIIDLKTKSLIDIFKNKAKINQAIKKTKIFNYDLMPASQELAEAERFLSRTRQPELKLKKIITSLSIPYHFILIDCPPSFSFLTKSAVLAADKLIIPIQCEYLASGALGDLLKVIEEIKTKPDLMILLTMYSRWDKLPRQIAKDIKRNFPGYVFETIIPRNISLAEAPQHGQPILQYASRSRGARAYRQLAEEVIELMEEEEKKLI